MCYIPTSTILKELSHRLSDNNHGLLEEAQRNIVSRPGPEGTRILSKNIKYLLLQLISFCEIFNIRNSSTRFFFATKNKCLFYFYCL